MKVKVKKLDKDAIIPKYMSDGAVGFDFHALENITIYPYKTIKGIYKVETGLAFEIPKGYEMNVRARSGLSLKYPNYIAMTGGGTVDSDYRGPINIFIVNHTDNKMHIAKGDRIAQGIISSVKQCVFEEVEELSDTKRGSGGFGSTGV